MPDRFEILRKRLHESIKKNGISFEKTRRISAKFDALVNSYYTDEIQFHRDSIMYTKYKESINTLRKLTREYRKFPTTDFWDKYAKEKDLLCSESLKYITGLNWHNPRNRTLLEK